MKVKRERREAEGLRSQGLERARTITGEHQAPESKRWEVLSAKRPSTRGQALCWLSANAAERRVPVAKR